jgi:hypothetical protein
VRAEQGSGERESGCGSIVILLGRFCNVCVIPTRRGCGCSCFSERSLRDGSFQLYQHLSRPWMPIRAKQHPGARSDKLASGCQVRQTSTGCQLAASINLFGNPYQLIGSANKCSKCWVVTLERT